MLQPEAMGEREMKDENEGLDGRIVNAFLIIALIYTLFVLLVKWFE